MTKLKSESITRSLEEIRSDPEYAILWFFVAVYPLIVIPNPIYLVYPGGIAPPSYFYAPRYVILIILATLALLPLSKRSDLKLEAKIFLPLGLFLAFALISTLLARYPETAWIGSPYRFTGYTTYLACAVLFTLASQTSRADDLLRWMVLSCAVVSSLALLQYFGLNLVPHEPFREGFISYGTMANPNFLGTYTAFVLPAAEFFFLQGKEPKWLACCVLIFGALLTSLSRGPWVGSILGFAVVAYLAWENRSWRKAFMSLVIVYLALILALAPLRDGLIGARLLSLQNEAATVMRPLLNSEDANRTTLDRAFSNRIFIWREVLGVLKDNWAFGIGPDHLIYQGIKTPGGEVADKAHNIYLETAVTMGIFSLMFYLALVSMLLCLPSGSPLTVKPIIVIMLVVYLIQGFFNIDVVMLLPAVWIAFGLASAACTVPSWQGGNKTARERGA